MPPGRTDALVEQVDLFPTLIEAATMHVAGGPTIVPHCPDDTRQSRATALCTEGFSLMPLISNSTGGRWPKAAFSQFVRSSDCCDCPAGKSDPETGPCCECKGIADVVMGYTVRVDKFRYTAWLGFNESAALPDWNAVVGTEL